ncbi:MAG TPA: MFS transporter [Acidiphilium sp.]|nr:MAG: MFS transporter [Acidiphilium sp. 21-60-14]OYV90298.1 MAG: MFS transporter [Acidiphilium sp. 37-60-79]OZB38403.1 MAG: MFS transporter [Acidiphilium sp. 34-60-192]HQT89069.1 MFS transporter [Acidiphilium sp.]HQU24351.1 MFS transporter [Acidiphilium sp.]
MPVLIGISLCHMLNDMMQVLLPAIYPLLKGGFHLNFAQIGLITLVYQVTGSLLQPMIGLYTDAKPVPFSLPVGMTITMTGIISLALATSYPELLLGAGLLGIGSAIFHPESSRIARAAAGTRFGFAQSIFQVGGNFGQSLGPLLAAFFILPRGRESMAWFAIAALIGISILSALSVWSRRHGRAKPRARAATGTSLSPAAVRLTIGLLITLMISKFVYLASFNSYYTFYLIHRFHVSIKTAQIDLFIFLGAAAVGTLIGGPIGDRIGRRAVIRASILGVLPFTLALPYVGLTTTILLSVLIGLILSSAFSAIVVYATELMPGRIGAVSGLFFGLAFGIAGVGAAGLGVMADWSGISSVYQLCAFLPLLGFAALFLPDLRRKIS